MLEKDKKGIQLQVKTYERLSFYLGINCDGEEKEEEDDKVCVMAPSDVFASHRNHVRSIYNGMRPIHLALSRRATEICEILLLEEEKKRAF